MTRLYTLLGRAGRIPTASCPWAGSRRRCSGSSSGATSKSRTSSRNPTSRWSPRSPAPPNPSRHLAPRRQRRSGSRRRRPTRRPRASPLRSSARHPARRRPFRKAARDKKSEPAPLPYSLAELQIDAGRRLGLNPQAVLSVCQSLYETHRLTTYPRSDCSYLPEGHLAQAADVVARDRQHRPPLAAAATGADLAFDPAPGTTTRSPHTTRSSRRRRLASRPFPMRARRLRPHRAPLPRAVLSAARVLPARRRAPRRRRTLHRQGPPAARSRMEAPLRRCRRPRRRRREDPDAPAQDEDIDPHSPLPPLKPGQVRVAKTRTVDKKTKPPRRFTAASLSRP